MAHLIRPLAALVLVVPMMVFAADILPDPAGKPQARLMLGEKAPEIAATTPDGKPIGLPVLAGDADHPKMIVLQFGSITEPVFRAHAGAVEKLAAKYADKAVFVIVYQQESHAADSEDAIQLNADQNFGIAQPLNLAERQQLAKQMIDRLSIKNQKVVVDAWNNTSSLRYGSYPNMTFVIDSKGILQAGFPWMDTARIGQVLDTLAAGKPLPPELKGSIKLSGSAPLDFTGAAMDMAGGRGPIAIGMALDREALSDVQRAAIYPALAEFMADLAEFRQAGTAARGTATPPVKPNATAAATTQKVVTQQDVQAANQKLHDSAGRLKTVIKQNSNPKQAAELFDALEQMQAQKLFANP